MDVVTAPDRVIYERVAPMLIRFATALVGPDEADDVVSTVIVRVLAKRPLGAIEKPEPYLMQAVMNEARSRHRGRRRGNAAVVRIGPGPTVRDAAEVATTELTDVVMAMPHQQRAAIYLVYWCDYSAVEASEAMGCEPATVRRYLHLARKKLERFINE